MWATLKSRDFKGLAPMPTLRVCVRGTPHNRLSFSLLNNGLLTVLYPAGLRDVTLTGA
jgi:hypothetical protein